MAYIVYMPHAEAWVNANTGEISIREPYKVMYWIKQGRRNE